jgi:hypothetical protein
MLPSTVAPFVGLVALLPTAAAEGVGDGGPLLPCGSSGDFGKDQTEVTAVFVFVKGVCEQRAESCPAGAPLPTSCTSTECQRAVRLATDSCAAAFAKEGWLKNAWAPVLNAAVAVCAAAPHPVQGQVRGSLPLSLPLLCATYRRTALALQRRVIAGHGIRNVLSLAAQGGLLLTDGMGSGGHAASGSGQDRAVVQAGPGQMAQLDLRALWLSKGNNVRVYIDGEEDGTTLQGTVLPPPDGGGRQFRSKPGGRIEVLLVTDILTSLSFVSFGVSAVCEDGDYTCSCAAGYIGAHCAVAFTVSGAKYSGFNGWYNKTDRVCNAKPVYQQRAGGPVLYSLRPYDEWRFAVSLYSNCQPNHTQGHEVTSPMQSPRPRIDSPDSVSSIARWFETIEDVGICHKPESNRYWCDDASAITVVPR